MPVKYEDNGIGPGGIPSGDWTPQGVTTAAVGGIPSGTDLGLVPTSIDGTLDSMFYPYIAPSVSIVLTPGAGLHEFGDTVAAAIIAPTTVKYSNNITTLTISRSGTGVIKTYAAPPPADAAHVLAAGGAQTAYTDISGAVVANTTYTATVGDGTATSTGTASYSFVYPFYYGVGAPGLSGAQVAALTKLVAVDGNKTEAFAPVAQVYYYAFPATYPDITAIFDGNGFNITADWTLHNPVSITGLDGNPVNYKVYEFNNINSVSQNITFNH